MIHDAIDKLKTERDIAFNLNRLDEYNTYCGVIRLIYICGTKTAYRLAGGMDKIINYVRQGHCAYTANDVKRLCNAAIRKK